MEDEFEMDLFNDDIELNLEEGSLLNNNEPPEEGENNDGDPNDDPSIQNNSGEGENDPGTVANEDGNDEGDENDSPNLFSSVATVLKEQGLLPSLDTESNIESVDDLAKAFVTERETLVKNTLIEKFGEEGYEYIVKGVPIEKYEEFKSSQDNLDSITEDQLTEDIEFSKKVIFQDYINQGVPEKKAEAILEKLSLLGDESIIEDAMTSLSNVKEFNKQLIENEKIELENSRLSEEKLRKENDKKLKDSVYNTKELLQGQSIPKDVQDRVYKNMTTIVGKSPDGYEENSLMKSRREDPISFDTKLYYIYDLTKGFTDFSLLTNAGKSNAVKELEKAMQNNSVFSGSGQPSYIKDKEGYIEYGDELV